eukprot:scaffold1503_cov150-Ochromonas_danica.AAC.6
MSVKARYLFVVAKAVTTAKHQKVHTERRRSFSSSSCCSSRVSAAVVAVAVGGEDRAQNDCVGQRGGQQRVDAAQADRVQESLAQGTGAFALRLDGLQEDRVGQQHIVVH